MQGNIIIGANPRGVQLEICDSCGNEVYKLYHKKHKDLPDDWYVCKKCLNEKG